MSAESQPPADLKGRRILVVEDTYLVAEVIVEVLRDSGCEVVGPASRVAHALPLAQQELLDGALLDVNLAGELCFPVAIALRDRGIPFILLTGYGEAALTPQLRDAPRLAKPFRNEALTRAAAALFGRPPAEAVGR